jgi:hypothetical protein
MQRITTSLVRLLASASWLTSCTAGFQFDAEGEQKRPPQVLNQDPGDNADSQAEPESESPVNRQSFVLNDHIKPVDYLFILDNSTSMDTIIDRVRQGLLQAAQEGQFPSTAQLAVMSTMISDPDDFTAIGPGINPYSGVELEPGFLDFVRQSAIDQYRSVVPTFADRWALDGCDQAWFKPVETNANGEACLLAAMQTSGARVGAEAGALAFSQLLTKYAGQPLFRDDALLNVVFVSDTHDPGRPDPTLLAATPDWTALNTLLTETQPVARLKFHALAPDAQCTTEDVFDHAYYQLAEASGGQIQDPCQTDNYEAFVAAMIESSQEGILSLSLNEPAARILGARVDGELFDGYTLSEDGQTLTLTEAAAASLQGKTLEVIYEPLAASEV